MPKTKLTILSILTPQLLTLLSILLTLSEEYRCEPQRSGHQLSLGLRTYLRRSWSVQLVQKLGAGLRDVLRASVMLPERSGKQQQQQLSQKVSAGQASDQRKRREREGHISPQRSPLGTNQSLPSASDTCSERCRSAQQVPIPFWVPEAARSTREDGVERHQKQRAVAGL